MTFKDIKESEVIESLVQSNEITIGFNGEYLDFNITNPSKKIADVLDLITYAFEENEYSFSFHGTQTEYIKMSELPATLKNESDVVAVLEIIVSKNLSLEEASA